MKKVIFTLGLASVLLLTGAMFNSVSAQTVYWNFTHYKSDSYLSNSPTFAYIPVPGISGAKTAVWFNYVTTKYDAAINMEKVVTSTTNSRIATDNWPNYGNNASMNINGNSTTSVTAPTGGWATLRKNGQNYYQVINVAIAYNGVKTTVPYLKLKITSKISDNLSIVVEEQLIVPSKSYGLSSEGYVSAIIPGGAYDVTDWTFGTDDDYAIYSYYVCLDNIIDKAFTVKNILLNYTLTTADLLYYQGNGNGITKPGSHNHPVILEGEGVEIKEPILFGREFQVPASTDLVFTVLGSKKPVVAMDEAAAAQRLMGYNDVGIYYKQVAEGWQVTIKHVDRPMTLTLAAGTSGTGANGDTGLQSIAADKVYGAGGTLYLESAAPSKVSVYNITGQLTYEQAVSGSATINLSKGLYIVKLNGKAYKVVL